MFACLFINAQNKPTDEKHSAITSIKYKVNSVKDAEEFNWKNVKQFFKDNKEEEIVKLEFEIDLINSENNFKSSFVVSGETKNIDKIQVKADKMLKGLIKISKKHETK
mgnify:CR=1 FL=1